MELRGKHILVTGADGFIGSHLVEYLLARGSRVRALAQYNSFNSWGWLEEVQPSNQLAVVTGDVRDPTRCRDLVEGIDVVFHLAALIAIPYSYAAPASYVETNVEGTLNICQAAREQGAARVVQTSTSEVYGTARFVPITEDHPLQPQSPYSASKIGADAMALSYFHAFGLPVTVARPFNTYGPRQSARAVIPTTITQLAVGKAQIKLGDLSPTRDFCYVEDTCAALAALAECDAAVGQVVNIGTNSEISIGDLVHLIAELMEKRVEVVQEEVRLRPKGSEVYRLLADNQKLHNLTGLRPTHTLEEGLKKTIAWFSQQSRLEKYKTHLYNV